MNTPVSRPTAFGHFMLDRKLAEGGMAEVFLARQQGPSGFEKQVVVKRILPTLSTQQDFVQMFLNEARLAARLSHPNVVQLFEAGEVEGQYYIAMEYIDGTDLRLFYDEADKSSRPTPPGVACRIVADLLAGLHYAHSLADEHGRPLGVVHRDVSPQNVLVTREGFVKIVDFGIAKATRAATQQTQAGQVKGKIAYMSPEQAMGRAVDARSDVFACGILLWELVTGHRLFLRPNDMASILAITEQDAPSARAQRRELPEALDYVLSQALARATSDRFPSALAMQTQIEQLIRSEGWPGDRRALERHIQTRIALQTQSMAASDIAEKATRAAPLDEVPPARRSSQSIKAQPAELSDGPTIALPLERDHTAMSTIKPPVVDPTNLATLALVLPAVTPPLQAPTSSTDRPRTPSGMRQVPAQPPLKPPMPSADRPRTPSGMRQMIPAATAVTSLHPPPYETPPMGAQPHAFDDPTNEGMRLRTGRRIAVVLSAAVLAGVGAVFALDLGGVTTITTSTANLGHVVVELSEPAFVEVDGKRARMEAGGELDIAPGRQLRLVATTLRGRGAEATRSIDLPPVTAGERVPLKINFPP